MSAPRPAAPDFKVTAASLTAEVQSLLASTAALHDSLVATLTPATATFTSVVQPLVDDEKRTSGRLAILSHLLASVSPDADVRAAAQKAKGAWSKADDALYMRQDLAALVAAVHRRVADGEDVSVQSRMSDDEDVSLLRTLHGRFTRLGAHIHDETQRARLAEAQDEVNELLSAAQREFGGSATGDDEGLWLSRAELAGVSETVLSSLKEEEEEGNDPRLWVTFRDAHYLPVMRQAKQSATRRRLYQARQRRFPRNAARLGQIAVLRDEIARLLGYAHHGALKMEERMEDSVDGVRARLQELRRTLEPTARQETAGLLAQKRKDASGDDDDTFYIWDRLYYENQQAQARFSVDQDAVAAYFEVRHALQGMLRLFEDLFALEFEALDGSVDVWHPAVMAHAVWDHADEAAGRQFLGYLYLDIFARPGKRGDPHHMGLQHKTTEADGTQHYPISAFVCSFPEPAPGKPTLLPHRDVRIMFHELGHAIHNLVSRTKHGGSCPKDFVEIPSKMLEYWIWEPRILQRLGKHYSALSHDQADETDQTDDAAGRLPQELADNIARTKALNQALGILGMLQTGLFDLALYAPADHDAARQIDTTALWNDTMRSVFSGCGVSLGDGDGWGQAGVSACFRGYDVAYYGYTTAIAISADLYHAVFARNPTSRAEGLRYRRLVLEPGASRPAAGLLRQYLGRDPSPEAIWAEIAQSVNS